MNFVLSSHKPLRFLFPLLILVFLSGCGGSGDDDASNETDVDTIEVVRPNPNPPPEPSPESSNLDTVVPNYAYSRIDESNVEEVVADTARIFSYLIWSHLNRVYTAGGPVYRDSSASILVSIANFCETSGQLNFFFNAPSKLFNSEGRIASSGDSVELRYINCRYSSGPSDTITIDGDVEILVRAGRHDGFFALLNNSFFTRDIQQYTATSAEHGLLEYIDGAFDNLVSNDGISVSSDGYTHVFDLFNFYISYSVEEIDFEIIDGEDVFRNSTHTLSLAEPTIINSEAVGMKYRIAPVEDIVLTQTESAIAEGSYIISSSQGIVLVEINSSYIEYQLDADNDGVYEESGIVFGSEYQ